MGAAVSVIEASRKEQKALKMKPKDFSVENFIAEGVSGKVYEGTNLKTDSPVAFKFFGYTKEHLVRKGDVWHEINAMLAVRGVEGIVQLNGFFTDTATGMIPNRQHSERFPVIVMELLRGGPLFGRINYRETVSEKFISHIFRKMLLALQSLHQKNYIHRDLKLDNVLFLEKSFDSPVKIIDLGNIVKLEGPSSIYQDEFLVGTPGCLAPESILRKEYSKKSDVWQAGCMLYSLLSGLPPFDPDSSSQVTDLSYYPMKGSAWDGISQSAKTLVAKMLNKDPHQRISLHELLQYPWLAGDAPDRSFDPDYFTRFKHLALRHKMKKFFLETSLLEGHKKRRKSLRDALPIFKQAADMASSSKGEFKSGDDEEALEHVGAFNTNMKLLKNMVVKSLSSDLNGKTKEIDFKAFSEIVKKCNLKELASLEVFNIFDIGNTGTIDPREFLLTMLAFRTDLAAVVDYSDESGDSKARVEVTSRPNAAADDEDEIRLYFNVFDINETGTIDIEELKIAVNFLLYMGSDEPHSLPNIQELFSAIDVTQNGLIDFQEFKQFYRHLITSNASFRR